MRSREQWRADTLAHLRAFPGQWFSAYDMDYRLTGAPRGGGHGRTRARIRETCEQLITEGLAERREQRPEGAPYGRPVVLYRAAMTVSGTGSR